MKSDIIILIYIALITLDALTDALFFKGNKKVSKNVEVLFKMGLFSACLLYLKGFDVNYLVCGGIIYFMLQMALFDFFFNLFAGFDLTHRGTTSTSDLVLGKLDKLWVWVWRGWWLFLAIFVHFMKFRNW
jgi:hypothetical protein